MKHCQKEGKGCCPACNRKTDEAPPEQDGIEGDCDLCGRWSSTLIEGACHSCRAWAQWQQRGE